jgi:hypothetical protein
MGKSKLRAKKEEKEQKTQKENGRRGSGTSSRGGGRTSQEVHDSEAVDCRQKVGREEKADIIVSAC